MLVRVFGDSVAVSVQQQSTQQQVTHPNDETDVESNVGASEDNCTIQRFIGWCEGKRQSRKTEYEDGTYQHPVEHAYSYKAEKDKFARFKDVERYFLNEYPTITTVLLTYTRPRSKDESIVEHANSFYPEYPITRKRGDCIKAAGYWNEYAGVSLLAPKDVTPNPCAETTHAHDMLVLPSFVSSECFDPLREEGVDVSIRYHRSDKVEAPPSVNRLDLEQERGATTSLSQEVGANLPVLSAIKSFREKANNEVADLAECEAKLDATHCPDYVTRWCAEMSCGKDGDPDENGIRRWRPLGEFKNIADSMKEEHSEERGYEDDNAKTNQCLSEGIGAPEGGMSR